MIFTLPADHICCPVAAPGQAVSEIENDPLSKNDRCQKSLVHRRLVHGEFITCISGRMLIHKTVYLTILQLANREHGDRLTIQPSSFKLLRAPYLIIATTLLSDRQSHIVLVLLNTEFSCFYLPNGPYPCLDPHSYPS